MDPSEITKLLKDSMLAVNDIKNAIDGNILSTYINQKTKLPCITNHIIGGDNHIVEGECSPIVQCRIWSNSPVNYSSDLNAIYGLIYDEFYSNQKRSLICSNCSLIFYYDITILDYSDYECPRCKETGNLSEYLRLDTYMKKSMIIPIQQDPEHIEIYSLPFNIMCHAAFFQ